MSALPASGRRTTALIVILAATFMQLLDISIVGVAAADIQQNLASGAGGIALVLVGYQIGFACTLITAARLGDIYGRRRLFLTGMVAFTIASVLCGLAPSIGLLIAARVVQGIASGLMFPQVLTVIQVMYPPAERGGALGAYGTTIGLGTILGPVIGGALIQFRLFPDAWRAIFLVNVPIGIAAIIGGFRLLPESTAPDRPRLDLAGAVLSAVGLGLLLYPIAQGPSDGWPPARLAMLTAGVVVLVGFVVQQRARTRHDRFPLLDLRLFANRSFTIGSFLSVIFYMGIPGFFLVFSLFLQDGNGFGPFVAGLTILPFALGAAITATPADAIAAKLGRGVIALAAGLLITGMTVMIGTLAVVGPDANGFTLIPAMLIGGLGFGLFVPTLIDLVLTGVPVQRAGAASGALTSLQQVGGALGVTLAGLVFTSTLTSAGTGDPAAFRTAMTAALVYEIVVFGLALLLVAALPRTRTARSTSTSDVDSAAQAGPAH
ncbi:MAG: DHA2 family efflux MFS transporter permease subunit [Pseudonocardia sp.]|nr:DHA2 family efflux MFS transporter permease subunit [Pseudonocardia sp.]